MLVRVCVINRREDELSFLSIKFAAVFGKMAEFGQVTGRASESALSSESRASRKEDYRATSPLSCNFLAEALRSQFPLFSLLISLPFSFKFRARSNARDEWKWHPPHKCARKERHGNQSPARITLCSCLPRDLTNEYSVSPEQKLAFTCLIETKLKVAEPCIFHSKSHAVIAARSVGIV